MEARKCPKCNGTMIVKDAHGTHTCWDCLAKGELDVHTKNIPDSRIKI
jgi:hypothetical protein